MNKLGLVTRPLQYLSYKSLFKVKDNAVPIIIEYLRSHNSYKVGFNSSTNNLWTVFSKIIVANTSKLADNLLV